ncbi:MAG: hypothetical protein ACOH2M_01295 [Cypionkella sp.]
MAYLLPYKYTSWEDQQAHGWQSRTAWKAAGVTIPKDAEPRGLALRKMPKQLEYDLFAEEDGVRFRDRVVPAVDQDAMDSLFQPSIMADIEGGHHG